MLTKVDEGEVDVCLTGRRSEFRDLYEELHTWTPAGGWSEQAKQFFSELARAGGIRENAD